MIVVGGILATASHGVTINGMFWMMTVARGIVGFGKRLQAFGNYLMNTYICIHRRGWRVSRILDICFRSCQRLDSKASWSGLHHGDQFPTIIRGPIRSVNLPGCAHGLSSIALQYHMARLLRDRVHLATIGILFPDSHAQLYALPSRSNQETCPLQADSHVLLEAIDWDLRCLVSLR